MPSLQTIDALIKEIIAADQSNDLPAVFQKTNTLVMQYMQNGFTDMQTLNWSGAANSFKLVLEQTANAQEDYTLKREQIALISDKQVLENLTNLENGNGVYQLEAEAYFNYCYAQYYNSIRNPGLADSYYTNAQVAFDKIGRQTGNESFIVLAEYCLILKEFAKAMEQYVRSGFFNAQMGFQTAMVLLQVLIEDKMKALEDEEEYKDFYNQYINSFNYDLQYYTAYFNFSDAKGQFNRRDFENAAERFASAVEALEVMLHKIEANKSSVQKNVLEGEYFNFKGNQLLSEAENCREKEQWTEAFDKYKAVRKAWVTSAGAYLKSGIPNKEAFQQPMMYQVESVNTYESNCKKEKALRNSANDLKRQIEELRSSLTNALKGAGITVNNNNTQEVTNTVQQNIELVQRIENNVRENIQKLLDEVTKSDAPEEEKKIVVEKAKVVLNSNEKGPKFLDKVKSFTGEIADVVANIGKVATPVMSAYQLLAPMLHLT